MWPLLILSVVSITVVLERIAFMISVTLKRQTASVEAILTAVESGKITRALEIGRDSTDYVSRTLIYALDHRDKAFSSALLYAAGVELKRFNRGISILDTSITLAPLLGLLGTQELNAPVAITGVIAEALIATAFGLGIAILSLIPFNFLNSQAEQARHEIEDAGTRLELLLHPKMEVTTRETSES